MLQRHTGSLSRPTLKRTDRAVLKYLERMARGNDGSTCTASIRKIAASCEISERQVQISTGRLIRAGVIKRVGHDFGNPDREKRGTVYRVLTRTEEGEGSLLNQELDEAVLLLLNGLEAVGAGLERLARAHEEVVSRTQEINKVVGRLREDLMKLLRRAGGGENSPRR